MKVMSFNILCAGKGHRVWEKRIPLVIDTIRKKMPDTLGVQESHYNWIKVLLEHLPEYSYAGKGRDDGKNEGEFAAVFYLKDKYEALGEGTFWLSDTPDKPSKGWDGVCTRICTYVKLRDKATGEEFFHFNTHLDHVGPKAQVNGAALIAERLNLIAGDLPLILTGDFNVGKDNNAYKTIIGGGLFDSRYIAASSDSANTFHLFDSLGDDEITIDYIFVRKNTKVQLFEVIKDRYDGEAPSDHNPVYAEISLG